jgi:hypothetical protein
MLSELSATIPAALEAPMSSFALTFRVFESMRSNAPEAHEGTQRLPKPVAIPPQGFSRPVTGSSSLLVLGSTRSSAFFPGRNSESVKKIQSGLAGTGISAAGFRLAIGICIPGVVIPRTDLGCVVFDLSAPCASATANKSERMKDIQMRIRVASRNYAGLNPEDQTGGDATRRDVMPRCRTKFDSSESGSPVSPLT